MIDKMVFLLPKLHADQHIEVELKMDELDLTAAKSKASYEEIKDYVLEHTGLKGSNLYIAQIKQKCGIVEIVVFYGFVPLSVFDSFLYNEAKKGRWHL